MPSKRLRLSLANKCQLLFGAAVIIILSAALSVVWLRMQTLVEQSPRQQAENLAQLWLTNQIDLGGTLQPTDDAVDPLAADEQLHLTLIDRAEFEQVAASDPFLARAIERFQAHAGSEVSFQREHDAEQTPFYRYARAVRESDLSRIRGGAAGGFDPELDTTNLADPLRQVLLIQLRDPGAAAQMMVNRIYIVAAGLFAGLLAIGVFWFITMRLILSPVRVLRDVAAKVSAGDLNTRSDINTADEFEELSDAFNEMLENQKEKQDQLRSINKSLDLKLDELAASNIALYEANKMKGEFLANVSHELRTPLNSMIGFAEVLQETLKDRTGPVDEKRKRYINHIITSSRRLLDLINDLLDLAKIEAGRMELNVTAISIADTYEGLVNLIRPQAERRNIALHVSIDQGVPVVQTDAGKLQQILFNFLSNAVKFTPEGGAITLAAATQQSAPTTQDQEAETWVRLSVSDTGPGIPPEDQQRIFDKFTQLDPSVTKHHGGTGLGLTISQQLATMLQGTIELDSAPGQGATFTLVIPVLLQRRTVPLMPERPAAST
ncbi:MAG: ATP-binding protein [Phycisphaeraceae bacterium]